MKKIIIFLFFIFSCFLVLYKYIFNVDNKPQNYYNEPTIEQKVNSTIDNMTIREKIAQMLILYYYKDTVTTDLKNVVTEIKPGGFILFDQNITTYDKTLNFVKTLQENSEVPLFISIDQEGGKVQRFKKLEDKGVTIIPSMYSLGSTNDDKLSYDVGKLMAEELRTIGVNMVYAPVLDIFSNSKNKVIGTRSFGSSKYIVSKMAISLSKGLNDNGIISVYKHFPGHGDTEADSHYDLPIIKKTKEQLLNEELVPFIDAINSGADVIMIGHLALPLITGDNTPASLSKTIVTDLLKQELKFDGLVVTDALNMGAITNNYSKSEIYEMAINSGVDILLMPGNSKDTIDLVEKSIQSGKIDINTINESVKKILTLKYSKLENYSYLDSSYLNSREHIEIISKIK